MVERMHRKSGDEALNSQAGAVLLGPRQVGKTTLAQDIAVARDAVHLDMELPADRQILEEPNLYLDEQVGRLVIIDEVQLVPDLFSALRGQIDRRRRLGQRTGQFLLLGSASNVLLRQSAESLVGRVSYHELTPFTLTVGLTPMKRRKVPRILCSNSNNIQITGNWRRECNGTGKEQPAVVRVRPFCNQPSKAELEADVSVDASP